MGFRFRKSKKIGPVRVTLSKSGLSYSVGVKGFRVTKTASGRVRTTASLPGTGIGYVKESSGRHNASGTRNGGAPGKSSELCTVPVEKKSDGTIGIVAIIAIAILSIIGLMVFSNNVGTHAITHTTAKKHTVAVVTAAPTTTPEMAAAPIPERGSSESAGDPLDAGFVPAVALALITTPEPVAEPTPESVGLDAAVYVLNTNTMKFHKPGCSSVSDMSEKNRKDVTATRPDIISWGYSPCGRCKP